MLHTRTGTDDTDRHLVGGKYVAQGRWRPSTVALSIRVIVNAALVPLRFAATEAIRQASPAGGWANPAPEQTGSDLMTWIALGALPIAFSAGAEMLSCDHHSSDDPRATGTLLHASQVMLTAWLAANTSSRIARDGRARYSRRLTKLYRFVETYLTWAQIARVQTDQSKSAHREELAAVAGTADPAERANLRPLGLEPADLTLWEARARKLLERLARDLAVLGGESQAIEVDDQIRRVA